MTHTLSLIVAMDRNRVIGNAGALPWHLPEDLKWFKRCTVGKPIVMGRRTREAIGRSLPDRLNLVLTSRDDFDALDATIVPGIEQALEAAAGYREIMVIGGGVVFEETIHFADRLYLTVVHEEFEGDTWFPVFDTSEWRETFREDHTADERNPHDYSFLIWERIGG